LYCKTLQENILKYRVKNSIEHMDTVMSVRQESLAVLTGESPD